MHASVHQADRRALNITLNSIGTELTRDDRRKLYSNFGEGLPHGDPDLLFIGCPTPNRAFRPIPNVQSLLGVCLRVLSVIICLLSLTPHMREVYGKCPPALHARCSPCPAGAGVRLS